MHDLEDGPRPRRRVTIDELRRRRGDVYLIAERYGVSNVRVFGSVARGEADDRSDLDLLIDVAPVAVCSPSPASLSTSRTFLACSPRW